MRKETIIIDILCDGCGMKLNKNKRVCIVLNRGNNFWGITSHSKDGSPKGKSAFRYLADANNSFHFCDEKCVGKFFENKLSELRLKELQK
jgi:hypothetical protein